MKQNTTIYKIENSHDIVKIIEQIQGHLVSNGKVADETDIVVNGYSSKLLVMRSEEKLSDWYHFFPKQYVDEAAFVYSMPSLLLLVDTQSGIYAVIGGSFYKYVLPFLDMSYGLNIYSRIMKPLQDEILSIKTRGVTGLRAGMQEQFKDQYKVVDYIKFGKIPVEMKIKLSQDKALEFFAPVLSLKSKVLILNISNGINLNKKLSFRDLGELISILNIIDKIKPNDFFSSYKEITNKEIISKSLKPGIINSLYDHREKILNHKTTHFDICYPGKVEDFYEADSYKIKLKEDKRQFTLIDKTSEKSEILPIILRFIKQNNLDKDLGTFNQTIYRIYISAHRGKSRILQTALIYHLNAELILPKIGTFIYLDAKWYKLRTIFINEMNRRCKEIFEGYSLNNLVLRKKWQVSAGGQRQSESDYNSNYNLPNYLVLDEVIVDSIELADVIYFDDSDIYLCHVKFGFSTELRELYSQVMSSARRLKNDLKDSENSYLKAIYSGYLKKRKTELSERQFIDLFLTRRIKYVMSFTGHLKNKDLVNNIEKYTSNIAKMSLIQCHTEMRTEYYDFHIEVIGTDRANGISNLIDEL